MLIRRRRRNGTIATTTGMINATMENYLAKLFNLEGKIAALTGAGGHLIGEISRGLAKMGAKVAILDSRIEKAEKVAEEIRDFGGDALPLCVDVRSKDDYQAALRAIL